MRQSINLRLINHLSELDKIAGAVDGFGAALSLDKKLRYQLRLVLDELVTNVITYGYKDKEEHAIDIAMAGGDGRLVIVIEDDAAAFDPLAAASPDTACPVEERHIGGLGIHLVRTIMDRVAYERLHGKNRLVLEKDIGEQRKGDADATG